VLGVRRRVRADAWRVGGELDGGGEALPVRALGRAWLGSGAA
jgi:hypothetical protein